MGIDDQAELGPKLVASFGTLMRGNIMTDWLSATVGFAAPVALAAMAFGQYAGAVLPGMPALPLGLAVVWLITAVRLRGGRHGSAFQVGFTLLKLVLILAFIIVGFDGGGGSASFAPNASDPARIFSAAFAVSLVFVMYAYTGWNAATYIVGDLANPSRSLPQALFVSSCASLWGLFH